MKAEETVARGIRKVSPAMAELVAENAKQRTLLEARHHNERAELAEKQQPEIAELDKAQRAAVQALLDKEAPAAPAADATAEK